MPSRADESPSAAELWRAYPLHPDSDDAVPRVTAGGPVSRSAGTGKPGMVRYEGEGADMAADARLLLQLGMLIAALYVVFLLVWFSRSRRVSARRAQAPFALLQAPTQWGEPEQRSVPAGHTGYMPTESASVRPEAPAAPPDPAAAWMGEIDWRKEDGTARFQLVAQRLDGSGETVVASPIFAWPPTTASSVEALTDAADELEATLLGAGWSALGRGSAWYARRFGWEPAAVISPARCAPALHAGSRHFNGE